VLDLSRSALYSIASQGRAQSQTDALLVERVHQLIIQHPTYGYHRVWALLRYREGQLVNHKKVYRLLKLKGWMVHQRKSRPGRGCRS
jgi:hypothetical protein